MKTDFYWSELNFNLNQPTSNGRQYDSEEFLRQLKEMVYNNKTAFITFNSEDRVADLDKVIGVVKGYDENEGNLKLKYVILKHREPFKAFAEHGFKLTSAGTGTIEEVDGVKYVRNFELTHFSFVAGD